MSLIPNRIVVYTRDVMNITGLQERTARKLLARIRARLEKPPAAFITVFEFCQFTGLQPHTVSPFLR